MSARSGCGTDGGRRRLSRACHRAALVFGVLILDAALLARPFAGKSADVSLKDILDRAASYTERYQSVMSDLVFVETYVQDVTYISDGTSLMAPTGRPTHRELESDMLAVPVPPPISLRPFRDVRTVNGRRLDAEAGRLAALFGNNDPDAFRKALAIATESARHNIGPVVRTLNLPGLPVSFLHASAQARFRFSLERVQRRKNTDIAVVTFSETMRPTIFRAPSDADNPSTGQLWIGIEDGRVVQSVHRVNEAGVDAEFTTDFSWNDALAIAVPTELTESCRLSSGRVEGRARYGVPRRFRVRTTTSIGVR